MFIYGFGFGNILTIQTKIKNKPFLCYFITFIFVYDIFCDIRETRFRNMHFLDTNNSKNINCRKNSYR